MEGWTEEREDVGLFVELGICWSTVGCWIICGISHLLEYSRFHS